MNAGLPLTDGAVGVALLLMGMCTFVAAMVLLQQCYSGAAGAADRCVPAAVPGPAPRVSLPSRRSSLAKDATQAKGSAYKPLMSAALLRQRSGSRLGIGPVHGDDRQDQKAEEAALLVSQALESAQLGVKRPPPGRGASSLPQLPFGGPGALAAQPPLRPDTGTPTTAHVSSPHDTGTTMGTMGGRAALCLSAPNGPTAPWDEEDDPAYVSPLQPPKPSAVPPRKFAAPTAAGSPAGVGLPYNPADFLPSRSGSEASVDRMSAHSCFIRRYGSGTSTASDFAMAALEVARASSGPSPVGDALLRKIEGALCSGSMRPEEAQDLLMKSFGCDLEELIRTELGPDAIPPLPAGAHRRSAGGTPSSDAISAAAFGGVAGSK